MTVPTFDADRVLAAVGAVLRAVTNAGTALSAALPSRQVTAAGAVPYDCEQVVARAVQLSTGAPESARGGSGTYPNAGANNTVYTLTVQVEIVRKSCTTPTGPRHDQIPDASAYADNLAAASTDTAVLISAADALANELLTLDTGATRRTVTYSAPSGGYYSTTCRIDTVA